MGNEKTDTSPKNANMIISLLGRARETLAEVDEKGNVGGTQARQLNELPSSWTAANAERVLV